MNSIYTKINRIVKKNEVLFFTVLISLIYIPLHKPVESVLSRTIVSWVLGQVESAWYNDVLFFLAVIAAITIFIGKIKNYVPSLRITLMLVATSIFYLYYRITELPWVFTRISFIKSIKYADFLFVITVVNVAFYTFRKRRIKKDNIGDAFLDDAPIGKSAEDRLGYSAHAKRVAEMISLSSFDKSFAIGINGKWGLGKTSFFDLIKRQLPTKGIIEINFNPWNSYTPQAIIKDFFDTVQQALRPYHSSLAALLVKYSEKLVSINESNVTKSFQGMTSALAGHDSLSNMFASITESIREINSKIIIYIDDLDRLDKDEIIEVIRLIRNTANFHNTFFVVAYDKNYISSALKDHNTYNPQQFLEKIFQIEVTLPQFRKDTLMRIFLEKLKDSLPNEFHEQINEAVLGTSIIAPTQIGDWLDTIRDVTRLTNSIKLSLAGLLGEVDIRDFIRLEILRLQYPSVYELLYKHRQVFFKASANDGIDNRYTLMYGRDKSQPLEDKDKNERYLKVYLKQNSSNLNLEEPEIDKIVRLLLNIFDDKSTYGHFQKKLLSVVYASKFDRYFSYALSMDNLSENAFNEGRLLSYEEFQNRILDWVNTGLSYDLQRRFAYIKTFDNRNDFEKVIKAIFYMANIENNSGQYDNRVGYDGGDLMDKLGDYYNHLSENIYSEAGGKEGLRNFIKWLFEKAESPYAFESKFSQHVSGKLYEGSEFPLTKEEITQISVGYLRKYCDSVNKIDDIILRLYWATQQTKIIPLGGDSYRSERVIPEEAKEVLREFILKDINGLLLKIVDVESSYQKSFTVAKTMEELFNGWDAFKAFIFGLDENVWEYLAEFKKFYLVAEKNNFTKYVPFDFKVIPISIKIQQR